jgi:hypothetical protein
VLKDSPIFKGNFSDKLIEKCIQIIEEKVNSRRVWGGEIPPNIFLKNNLFSMQ